MKLRYQLRGLGIGMVLAALLMGVATGDGTSLSDAEIKARALELGMVESDSLKLTDIVSTQVPASNPDVESSPNSDTSTQVPSSNANGASTQEPSPNPATTQESSPNPNTSTQAPSSNGDGTSTQGTSPNPGTSTQVPSSNADGVSTQVSSSNYGDADMITIVIEQGEIASEICVKMEEAGIIEDAAAMETFLCERNWSRSIRDGIYHIPLGTSMEDIAGMITRNP